MEIEKIGAEALRIRLTKSDLSSMQIKLDAFDYNDIQSRRALWKILNRAKEKTGFDAFAYPLFIQLFPKPSGECEFIITKKYEEKEETLIWVSDIDRFFYAVKKAIQNKWEVFFFKDSLRKEAFYILAAAPSFSGSVLAEWGKKIENENKREFLKNHAKIIPAEKLKGFLDGYARQTRKTQ